MDGNLCNIHLPTLTGYCRDKSGEIHIGYAGIRTNSTFNQGYQVLNIVFIQVYINILTLRYCTVSMSRQFSSKRSQKLQVCFQPESQSLGKKP
jgi:hypothetical protein